MSRTKLFIAGSCVAAVVLSSTVALAKPLSERQWRKQANAVCTQANRVVNDLQQLIAPGSGTRQELSAEQLAAFVAQSMAPTFKQSLASIDALDEPNALKKDVKKFEAAVSRAVAALQADPSVLAGGDNPFAKANKIARRLGLKDCVQR